MRSSKSMSWLRTIFCSPLFHHVISDYPNVYQKSEPNCERSLQRTSFITIQSSQSTEIPWEAATAFSTFSPAAQHNSTFPSNYIEFPRTGMKAFNIPWECVMFQTGAHAVLSTRGDAHVTMHQRNWQFRQMRSIACYIQHEKTVTRSLRPASINYLVLKGLIILLLKPTYNLLFVPKGCFDIILENK